MKTKTNKALKKANIMAMANTNCIDKIVKLKGDIAWHIDKVNAELGYIAVGYLGMWLGFKTYGVFNRKGILVGTAPLSDINTAIEKYALNDRISRFENVKEFTC